MRSVVVLVRAFKLDVEHALVNLALALAATLVVVAAAAPAAGMHAGAAHRAATAIALSNVALANSGYLLSVTLTGTGTGVVTDQTLNINCPGSCIAAFIGNDAIELTATADVGSTFIRWVGGPCDGQDGPCAFAMPESNVNIAAEFLLNRTVTVTLAGAGVGNVLSDVNGDDLDPIDCGNGGTDCDDTFPPGTVVTLTPQAAAGSVFTVWNTGPCFGSTGPCVFVMLDDADVDAEAQFDLIPTGTVSVTVTGTGTGSVASDLVGADGDILSCGAGTPGDCDDEFVAGETVTLTPTAGAGSVFAGWATGPCAGQTGPCSFSVPEAVLTEAEAVFYISDTFCVTNTNNGGMGSLRNAINMANADPGLTTICFNIPEADAGYDAVAETWTIAPTNDLPNITTAVIVDGLTQPGASCNAWPPTLKIILDGSSSPLGNGLNITGGGSTVRGLVISNWFNSGIRLAFGSLNKVECNFIGTDHTGTADEGNGNDGVNIVQGSSNNVVGTDGDGVNDGAERNLISGNDDSGVMISDAGSDNRVSGNYIGTTVTGLAALGNTDDGVHINGAAFENVVGTNGDGVSDELEGNVLSGNLISGVMVNSDDTDNNVIAGNLIGLGADGTTELGNGADGVLVQNGPDETRIGTNGDGVSDALERNVISANAGDGIEINGSSSETTVAGNYIGTDAAGTSGAGNTNAGVHLLSTEDHLIGTFETGAEGDAERNVISDNGSLLPIGNGGVFIEESTRIRVAGNYIGTDVTGTMDLGNFGDGVCSLLGGSNTIARNILSGNGDDGVDINQSAENSVTANRIGTGVNGDEQLGNDESGVDIQFLDSDNNVIGASESEDDVDLGNIIAFNAGDGVVIRRGVLGQPRGNVIRQNSIHANGELGIDLDGEGVTANDIPLDPDIGANDLLNFPVITLAMGNMVAGTYDGPAFGSFIIDIYSNTTPNPSGNGEGERWIGSTVVFTDGTGHASWMAGVITRSSLDFISATATEIQTARGAGGGNLAGTSEFSETVETQGTCEITCPADIVTGTNEGVCSAVVEFEDPTPDGDCDGFFVTCTPPSGSTFAIGITSVTCDLHDPLGNVVDTCTFNVEVIDDDPPTIVCPANITQDNDLTRCDAVVNYTDPVPVDNCPDAPVGYTVACTPPSGSVFPVGTTVVTCTLTDPAGVVIDTCTFNVTVEDDEPPTLVCNNPTIPVGSCGNGIITESDVVASFSDNCPLACMEAGVTFSPEFIECPVLGQIYNVAVSAVDCHGNTATCTAQVTFTGVDCNANGFDDGCDICSGFSLDCNQNGVPDECECFWDNGKFWNDNAAGDIEGQISHVGGAVPFGIKAAEDFYLEPGWIHKIDSFTGTLLNNSWHGFRRARLEFYEDCNGRPDGSPIRTFHDFEIIGEVPLNGQYTGFTLLTYRFDLCDLDLWLDGGKTYWVSLIGLSDNVTEDISFWVATNGTFMGIQRPPIPTLPDVIGLVPVKTEGTSPPHPGTYGPWIPVNDCCIGCRNLEFQLSGQICKILWDNGPVDLAPATRGGWRSGSYGLFQYRSADNFTLGTCHSEHVCMIDGYIWTNCNPIQAFIEIWDNDCKLPGSVLIHSGVPTEVRQIPGEFIIVNGFRLDLYHVKYTPANLELAPGVNYWISIGASGGNSANGRTLFAYSTECDNPCDIRITGAATRTETPVVGPWTEIEPVRDLAFRIASGPGPRPPPEENYVDPCPVDINNTGDVTVQDLFDFLAAWFNGCP